MKKRRTATPQETETILIKLREVCRKVSDGYGEYVDKHITDETIAEQIGCPQAAVARYRKAIYGQLRTPNLGMGAGRLAALQSQLDAMEEVVREDRQEMVALSNLIEDLKRTDATRQRLVDDLIDRFHKLTITLALSRVSDVKHLGEGIGQYKNGPASPQQRDHH